jgi:ADP-heptose:LPS heptosyltransferase
MAGLVSPVLSRMVRSGAFSLPKDIGNDSRVLVVDSGDLTELLFFYPVVSYLKNLFPRMRITFLVREGNSELVRGMGQVSEMISYEPAHFSLSSTTYFSLLKRIRRKDFSIVFMLGKRFNFARSLLALLSGAGIRVGFSQEFTFPYINLELRSSSGSGYEGDRAAKYLGGIGYHVFGSLPRWRLPDQDVKWARQMIHFRKPEKDKMLLAVDPGKGKGDHRLVDESFAFLINNFVVKYPAKVMLLTHNLDGKGLERFRSHLKCDLLDLEPKNLKEGLALLSCADLLLSGNTDFFHFGVQMGIPTVGLFTRYDTSNWIPKGTPWVQILQGVKGQQLSLDEFFSKIDTLLHLVQQK